MDTAFRSRVVRRPAVAGYYYPATADALAAEVEALMPAERGRLAARAVIVPHGSYRRSGAVAGAAFASVALPRRCILVGPSHTGRWTRWNLMMDGAYRTPLGEVPIDQAMAAALRDRCPFLEPDDLAQAGEHVVEVQLPFLQRRGPGDLQIVPVLVDVEEPEALGRFADALAQVVRMAEEPVLLIASTDLSHYEPLPRAQARDRAILDEITRLNSAALLEIVARERIVMCGVGAAVCTIEAARALGAQRADVVAYRTSAEAGGDPNAVTGYAGVVIS